MPIRISGLASGLDTEALVSELVGAYRTKTQKYTKAQTKLSWKQDAWKELNSKIYKLYTNIGNFRYDSAYNLRKTTVSDTTKATVTATSSAAVGAQTLEIKQIAKSGYLTGGKLASSTTGMTTLSSLGYSGGDGMISVTSGDKITDIKVTNSTSVNEFISSLNDAGVKASYDATNNRIFVTAEETGADNDFTLMGSDASGSSALYALGLNVQSAANTEEYAKLSGYAVITNGAFDQGATLEKIKSIRGELTDKSTIVTNNKAKIAYAQAYKDSNDATKTLSDDEKAELKNLLTASNLSDPEKTRLEELEKQAGLVSADDADIIDKDKVAALKANYETMDNNESVLSTDEKMALETAYSTNGTVGSFTGPLEDAVNEAQEYIDANSLLDNDTDITVLAGKIKNAYEVTNGLSNGGYNTDAVRIDGQDAIIMLNGASYQNSTNNFSINGLDITATAVTNGEEISITTENDAQGLYDKIKGFITEYNDLMNEMTKLYNADTASGYEPLTDEERDAMSDTEVEKWETKIKDSLLRRDSTLSNVMSIMQNAMSSSYTVNGKSYALSSFGIATLGYLNAEDNEENAYHIDGNAADSSVSGKEDKLLTMLKNDPETITDFFKQLSTSVYTKLNDAMKSTTLSSVYTVYNDKEMAREYSDYTTTISKWEDKLTELEDSYYKKFAAMESALATLQSQQSSLSSLFGS